jgi:hypothetical protein
MDSLVATAISSVSVLIAVVALVYSVQQVHLMRRQNLLPVALDFFREARTPDWFVARDWIINHLAIEHSPDLGVSGLPESAREHVRKVGFFYDNLGVFVAYRVVEEDLVLGFFGVGMNEVWAIICPYIHREEEIRQMRYMAFFSDLVVRFSQHSPADIYRKRGLRQARCGLVLIYVRFLYCFSSPGSHLG